MRRKHISFLKRSISSVLTVSMLLSMIQVPVSAASNKDVYLPENEMEQDILSSDVFYLATASAQLREGAGERYLLAPGQRRRRIHCRRRYGEDL